VDAIEAQDPERGEQRMREHIRHFHDTIKLRL
jgi:DNA-binding GntR family transcriptional regulator